MATLTLRNVPDELVAHLKARARRNQRSLNN
jgi:plasmid stability protein